VADLKAEMLEGMRCKCGKPSVEFDSWFGWSPCEDHKHLSPVEYSRMEDTNLQSIQG
jgi:hypothetical protein